MSIINFSNQCVNGRNIDFKKEVGIVKQNLPTPNYTSKLESISHYKNTKWAIWLSER
jgi:hypothetical protein